MSNLKKLKLIILRIQSDYAIGKSMFIMYLIGTVLSVLVFTYFYGNFIPAFEELDALIGDVHYRTYRVNFNEPVPVKEDILEILKDTNLEKISTSYTYISEDPSLLLNIEAVSNNDEIHRLLSEYYGSNPTPELTEQEFDSNIILLGDNIEYDESTITIEGTEFQVIKTKNNYYSIMPLKPYLRQGFKMSGFSFVLKEKLNTDDNYKLISDVTRELSDKSNNIAAKVEDPFGYTPDNGQAKIFTYFLQLCLIYLVCFISCAFLFNYIFKRNLYENVIYMIIGAKRRLIFFVAVSEIILLSLFSSIIAILIHVTLYESVFTKINNYQIYYKPIDYIIITLFVTLLSVIIMLPFFINTIKNTAIDLKNKYI